MAYFESANFALDDYSTAAGVGTPVVICDNSLSALARVCPQADLTPA